MAKLTQEEIVKITNTLLFNSTGYEDDTITKEREKALDYYFMRPRGDEVTGRSKVISGDLSAMTEAVLSQIMDSFTTDNVVEFKPFGKEDEDQAQLESDTVSHFIMDSSNGFMNFQGAIKDALLLRNGIMKVWVDEKVTVKLEEYEKVDPIAFTTLTQAPDKKVDVINYDLDAQTLSTRETTTERELKIEAIPLESFRYTSNWTSVDLKGIPFCAELKHDTRSALIEMGFNKKKVDGLKASTLDDHKNAVRNPQKEQLHQHQMDKSQEMIEYHECHLMIDTDGDGIAELRRIIIASTTLLDNIEVEDIPYGAGVVFINSHRFLGVSLYDKLKQIQDISTGLKRALLDNANATNKSRLLIKDGKVNSDDLAGGAINGNIRVKGESGPITDSVAPLLVPDISQGILLNLQNEKLTRSEMGGAALELASGQAQLGSDSIGSQGLDRAYSVMEQLSSLMAKNIAETLIRTIYTLTHSALRQYFTTEINIKRSGKWSTPIPSEWQKRTKVNVKIGLSPGERQRKVNSLNTILDKQIQFSGGGLDGILVNDKAFHVTLMDWARASEIDNPEQYFIDPASEGAQQVKADNALQAKQSKEQQFALMDQALALEQLRTSFDKYKQDTDLQFKYYDANLKSEVEEAKIVGSAVANIKTKELPNGKADEQGAESKDVPTTS